MAQLQMILNFVQSSRAINIDLDINTPFHYLSETSSLSESENEEIAEMKVSDIDIDTVSHIEYYLIADPPEIDMKYISDLNDGYKSDDEHSESESEQKVYYGVVI